MLVKVVLIFGELLVFFNSHLVVLRWTISLRQKIIFTQFNWLCMCALNLTSTIFDLIPNYFQ